MVISDKEFYAAHGIDYNPAKWLQGYTDYALIKMLEDVKNEIELESHDQQYCPYPKDFFSRSQSRNRNYQQAHPRPYK